MKTVIIIFIYLVSFSEKSETKRVCKDISSYYFPNSKNCWDNKDGESNVTQIIDRWNATVEEHYLTTDDGYQILVVRAYKKVTKTTPIIIGHGQHHNSLMFVNNRDKSLTYTLIDAGYEVYLINYRGSRYSLGHVNKTANDRSYWNFGLHEMGIYDLRKCISFVNEKTGQRAIYLGYSAGTTVGYIYKSMFLQEAPKFLKGVISLAPLTTLKKPSPAITILAKLWNKLLRPLTQALFDGRALVRLNLEMEVCSSSPFWWYICATVINGPIVGIHYQQIDPVYRPVQIVLFEDTIPVGLVDHFVQIKKSGIFRQFDYGIEINIQKYGTPVPPEYPLSEITVPIAVFGGRNDPLSPPENVEEIYSKFTSAQCGLRYVENPKWNSGDFVFAKDMKTEINIPVLEKIEEFEDGKICTA